MKKLLILFLALSSVLATAQTVTRRVIITPQAGYSGSTYSVLSPRDLTRFPLTPSGNKNFTNAVASGVYSLTVEGSGCIIASGTRPPLNAPACSANLPIVANNTGIGSRYTYSTTNNGTLQVRGAGSGTYQLKIETVSGAPLTLSNAQNSSLPYNTFLGAGSSGDPQYPMDWTLWGVPQVPIKLTFTKNGLNDPVTFTAVPTSNMALTTPPVAATTAAPPVGTVSANNLPSWETFDYTPITTNSGAWPSFDSRTDEYGHVVGEYVQLSTSQINVRIHKRHGASPTHISGPDGQNLINIHDLGTMLQMVAYRGGRTSPNPNATIDTQWAQADGGGVGNDPIQAGDVYGNASEVLAFGYNSTTAYAKVRMKNWAVQNEATDAILEQWVRPDGPAAHIWTKITFNRSDDKTFYEARAQEWPCMYTTVAYRRLKYIDANGNLATMENQAGQFDIGISKPWVAMENVYDATKAIGLWSPGLYFTTQWQKSVNAGGSEFANGAGYTANRAFIHMAWNDVIYSHHAVVVGDVNAIKTWADAQADPRNTFVWKFNARNGRGHWQYRGGYDSGYPTPNTGVEITKTGLSLELYSPYVAVPANTVSTLYIRMALTGGNTSHRLFFEKTGQQEIDALNAGQTITFTTTNDGQYRTYAIPVSSNGAWSGIISKLKFQENNSSGAATTKVAWINTVDADPQP